MIAQPAENGEERHHDNGEGDHHGGEHEREEEASAFETDFSEGISSQRAGEHVADDGERCNDQRIASKQKEMHAWMSENFVIVFPGDGVGNELRLIGHDAVERFEAGGKHPEEGEEEGGADEDEH